MKKLRERGKEMNPTDRDEEKITVGERKRNYAFFSGVCSGAPSKKLVSMICDGTLLQGIKYAGESRGMTELKSFVNSSHRDEKGLLNALTAEYTRLFVLPLGFRPYESFYLDEEKKIGGKVTMGVKRFYKYAGAEIEPSLELPDHIGVELDFMKFLCTLEEDLREKSDQEGLKRCVEIQEEFLNQHLLQWGGLFCTDLAKETTSGFYRGIALLIEDFLQSENDYIGERVI